MANYVSGPILAVLGALECAAGKAKELVGKAFGHNDLIAEGQAQQDQGDAERAAGEETEAQEATAAAEAHEEREHAEP
ncbi:MAG: hypothetical protein JWR37_1393 [Mycobacterium sp.]|nr:hypothetical protein [Mycobacterium sp.]